MPERTSVLVWPHLEHGADIYGPDIEAFTMRDAIRTLDFEGNGSNLNSANMQSRFGPLLSGSTAACPKEFLVKLPTLQKPIFFEDLALQIYCKLGGRPIYGLDQKLIFYRVVFGSASHNLTSTNDDFVRI